MSQFFSFNFREPFSRFQLASFSDAASFSLVQVSIPLVLATKPDAFPLVCLAFSFSLFPQFVSVFVSRIKNGSSPKILALIDFLRSFVILGLLIGILTHHTAIAVLLGGILGGMLYSSFEILWPAYIQSISSLGNVVQDNQRLWLTKFSGNFLGQTCIWIFSLISIYCGFFVAIVFSLFASKMLVTLPPSPNAHAKRPSLREGWFSIQSSAILKSNLFSGILLNVGYGFTEVAYIWHLHVDNHVSSTSIGLGLAIGTLGIILLSYFFKFDYHSGKMRKWSALLFGLGRSLATFASNALGIGVCVFIAQAGSQGFNIGSISERMENTNHLTSVNAIIRTIAVISSACTGLLSILLVRYVGTTGLLFWGGIVICLAFFVPVIINTESSELILVEEQI